MSELNLEEKLEVAMDSFNDAMNSVLIILEEKQKLKEEKQELLKLAKKSRDYLLNCSGIAAEYNEYKKVAKLYCKLDQAIQKYEEGEE